MKARTGTAQDGTGASNGYTKTIPHWTYLGTGGRHEFGHRHYCTHGSCMESSIDNFLIIPHGRWTNFSSGWASERRRKALDRKRSSVVGIQLFRSSSVF